MQQASENTSLNVNQLLTLFRCELYRYYIDRVWWHITLSLFNVSPSHAFIRDAPSKEILSFVFCAVYQINKYVNFSHFTQKLRDVKCRVCRAIL